MSSVMPGLYILTTPTLAITIIDGVRMPITIPQNATVKAGQAVDSGSLIEVQWEGRSLLMFIVDLQQRACRRNLRTGDPNAPV